MTITRPVADPGCSRGGGANSKGGCEKLLFGQLFPKKYTKLKEFGTRGERKSVVRPKPHPPRSANGDGNLSVYSVVLAMSKFSMRRSNPGEGINWGDQIWSPQKKPSNLPHLPPTSETSSEHLRVFLTPLPVRHLLNIWSKLGILTFFSKQFPTKKVLSQI